MSRAMQGQLERSCIHWMHSYQNTCIAVSSVIFRCMYNSSLEELKERQNYNFYGFQIILHILHSCGVFVIGAGSAFLNVRL